MNFLKYILNKTFIVVWLSSFLLVSCLSGEYDVTDEGMVNLQLNITAREESEAFSRATEVGTNSEYIHSLCILIVRDGKVVKKFLPDFSMNPAAQNGNLKNWISESFLLEMGNYTLYAFANIDSYFSSAWSSLTGIGEGEDISSLNIEQIILDDPASKLDLVTYFIPMSAKQQVAVTSATKSLSIGLDRLVSKVRMSVTGKIGTNITGLSFGGYSDKVTLFNGEELNDESYLTSKAIILPEDGVVITDGGSSIGGIVIPDFYVNSSPAGHNFSVTIGILESDGIVQNAQAITKRDELPRNSIYPLTLQLNDYDLDLDAQCWVSPIGSFPVEVKVAFTPDTYEVEVPEGCQFSFVVNGVKGGTNIEDLTTTWNILSPVTGIAFDGETSGVTQIKGHVTASAGKSFDLGLLVAWRDGAASYSRSYTVTLKTADITEFPLYGKSGITGFAVDYLQPEMLNIFIK